MAAVLAGAEDAVLSHRDAAALWELRRPGGARVEVSSTRAARDRPGLRFHQSRRLPESEVTIRHGIPVTTVARTLLDLADVVPRRALVRALEECERRDRFDLRAIEAAIAANPGRRGGKTLRAVLEEEVLGTTLTRSELEEAFFPIVAALGLPQPKSSQWIGTWEVDFLWEAEHLVVEADHHRYHRTRFEFERDRAKDLDLRAAGYTVVRFSDGQIARADPRIAEALRASLQSTS